MTWSKILGLWEMVGMFLFFFVYSMSFLFEGHVFRIQFNIWTPRDTRHTINSICFSIRSCYIATNMHILYVCLFLDTSTCCLS